MLQTLTINPQGFNELGTSLLVDPPQAKLPDIFFTPYPTRPNYYPIRIFVIGIPEGVESIVHELYRREFAQVNEWSRQLPARHPGEIMRIMTRDFLLQS